MIRKLAVYCGSRSGNNPTILAQIQDLGKWIAQNHIELVYGGGSIGIMGILADSVLKHGGKVTGVIPRFLDDRELGHQGIQNLVLVDSMHERKLKMTELADAFLILPGSIGTMDEFFEVLTWRQLGIHEKPIMIMNLEGFYDPLIAQLNQMKEKDFLDEKTFHLIQTISDLSALVLLFKQ